MSEINYPGISDRVKAIMTDSIVLILFMLAATYAFSQFENTPDYARMTAFLFIFGLYDPIFTSIFGGTIGHFVIGIRVKRKKNKEKNILLPFAIFRFAVKVILGWLSLLTMSRDEQNRAIHDYLSGSVVIYSEERLHELSETIKE